MILFIEEVKEVEKIEKMKGIKRLKDEISNVLLINL